jgi:pilus assembly protein CpaF
MRISEITALDSGDYAIQDLFGFQQTGIDDRGIARGHFYATGKQPHFARRLAEIGIDLPESLFAERKLTADSSIGPMSYTEPAEAHAHEEHA